MTVFGTQPWWYWLILVLFALVVVTAFGFFRWWLATEATKLTRRLNVLGADDVETNLERLYWTHLRHIEFFNAKLITFNRARHAHPERFAALVSEGVPLNDVIEAMAS